MSTPHSAIQSPTALGMNPFQTQAQVQDADFSDFLSFMGLDAAGSNMNEEPAGGSGTALDESNQTTSPQLTTGVSTRQRTKRANRGSVSGSKSYRDDNAMDVQQQEDGSNNSSNNNNNGGIQPLGPSQMMGLANEGAFDTQRNMQLGLAALWQAQNGSNGSGGEFDAAQASLLQQQLEQIHMQSPALFDPSNPHSPYHALAQMYMPSGTDQQGSNEQDSQQVSSSMSQKWPQMNGAGILTPAPSGEMYPQSRTDMMTPMQLDMLARGERIEGHPDIGVTPMLSPALSGQAGSSTYASPANFSSIQPNSQPSPIEALQEQQRHFQQQLAILQQQQRQLEATAAAVASSPYLNNSAPGSSGPSRAVTTPGVSAPQSAGAMSSPGYFSPLTSPALDGSRVNHFGQQQHSHRHHPLSALSSPALNPIGSSGGAQQTLSPAFGPQSNADMADPEFLSTLAGYFDSSSQQGQSQQQQQGALNQQQIQALYNSPVIPTNGQTYSSPLVPATGGGNGAGPNRQSLPSKTRPSPMMKPTVRSSRRDTLSGTFSVPSSPISFTGPGKHSSKGSMSNLQSLPPAALQPGQYPGSAPLMPNIGGSSTPSTPSPVDLAQMMPPPPVPNGVNDKNGMIAPMTPATLMNIGGGGGQGVSRTVPPPSPANTNNTQQLKNTSGSTAKKQASANAQSNGNAKKGTTSRLAINSAGKRALAMRPPTGVGVRAAVKGAATAAALPPPEGETRKTSHKAAEQKRRDSLKAGFDELRLLLPAINTEALDPESGEPIPGSSAPRLLPKSSLVPDDNPNRGVSKVALLKFSNEYIVRLHDKVEKRDNYIDKLRDEIRRLRLGGSEEEVRGDDGEDLLDMDMLEGEEDDLESSVGDVEGDRDGEVAGDGAGDDVGMDEDEGAEDEPPVSISASVSRRRSSSKMSVKKSPALGPTNPGTRRRVQA